MNEIPQGAPPPAPEELLAAVRDFSATAAKIDEAIASGAKVEVFTPDKDATKIATEGGELRAPARSDAEAFAIVKDYLHADGPLFVSKPVNGKVFIGQIPRLQDTLDAEIAAERLAAGSTQATQLWSLTLATVLASLRGWLPEGSNELSVVLVYKHDRSKWPPLRPVDWMQSRDPYILKNEVAPVMDDYQDWRIAATPTEVELKNFSAQVAAPAT